MAVSTTENEEVVGLYDTTSGLVFGPSFATNSDAEEFLEWLKEQAEEGYAFENNGETVKYVADARHYTPSELSQVIRLYREEQDEDE